MVTLTLTLTLTYYISTGFFYCTPWKFCVLNWSSPNTKIWLVPPGNEDSTYFYPNMNIIGSVPVAKRDFDNIGYWKGPVQYSNISGMTSKTPCIYLCTLSMSLLLWAAGNLCRLKISHKHMVILWDIFNVIKFPAAHLWIDKIPWVYPWWG